MESKEEEIDQGSFDIDASGTVAIFNFAKKMEQEGKKLIHLEVGELDFDTPKYIIDAAINGLVQNHTKYSMSKGILPLRQEIARYTENRYQISNIDPETQIMVTPGAKFALFLGLLSLLSADDEVIVFSPSYPSFRAIPKAIKTKIQEVCILNGSETIPTSVIFKDFCSKVNEKTRIIILNGPCNPTGQVIGSQLVKMIWQHVQDFPRVVFIADDIYEQFIYSPATFETEAHHDPGLNRTILINGLSKSMCMTGFRVGWIVTNAKLIRRFERIQQNSITCVAPFIQDASLVAMRSMNEEWPEYLEFRNKIRTSLNSRRDFLIQELSSILNQKIITEGAFYIFPDFSSVNIEDEIICRDLIQEGIVLTPGSAFGKGGKGHLRISYTVAMDDLKTFITILKSYIQKNSH